MGARHARRQYSALYFVLIKGIAVVRTSQEQKAKKRRGGCGQ
ncbi:hypothetical protein ASAC_0718 [Acidilobus saccharovorans 345-15]|uniref:Uncharacterized protein n=1 Tax=Acidilobus saccharovorans (strain DSM 16705 / JCM 18335 / VKM B-2471 / 345-15) TaxID=666510 RepID=D9Q1D6_ACIS3|nr:hypothetical protein ASAC_0718 [Acidilobus saccharovorans 345-15]